MLIFIETANTDHNHIHETHQSQSELVGTCVWQTVVCRGCEHVFCYLDAPFVTGLCVISGSNCEGYHSWMSLLGWTHCPPLQGKQSWVVVVMAGVVIFKAALVTFSYLCLPRCDASFPADKSDENACCSLLDSVTYLGKKDNLSHHCTGYKENI